MSSPMPSTATMFRRALVLKCPRCGSRRTFIKRWLGRHERCRTCGIRWRREHGFELGPIALSVIVTFGVLGVSMFITLALSGSDVEVLPLFLVFAGVATIVPMIVTPFAYLVWLAFDLAVHKPDDRELAEADAAAGRAG